MIESREGCDPLELTRRRRGQIPLRTTLSQIPLKSFGFPGAESARKRFFLRGQAPTPKKSARFHRTCRWKRLEVERVHTLSSSPGAVLLKDWFPTKQAILLRTLFPTTRAWGAPLPYTPSGDGVREGCDPLALSRGWFGGNFDFRRCRKVLRWRCWFSAARRTVRMRISFPATRAWGAPLPYVPSGDGVREGRNPLALSRGCSMKVGILDEMGIFLHSFWHFAFAGAPAAFILARLSVYASAQRSTSNMPWVVSFRWGMTGRAMKESVMNGSMPRCAPRA